jgi:hypothetical protein
MPLITIPATKPDYAVARMAARHTNPLIQNCARAATWPAGGKVLGAIIAATWLLSRAGPPRHKALAGHLARTVAAAVILPKALKTVIDQERPNRSIVGRNRRGVKKFGQPQDWPFSTYWSRSVGLRRRISEACAAYLAARHPLVSNACRSSSALDERRSYRSLNGGCDRAGNSKTFQTSWRRGLAPESQ